MIDGLKLTMSGKELRRLLERRAHRHDEKATWWSRQSHRKKEDETDDAPLLPGPMCEYEAERCAWRARVLLFIRDHVDAAESYRLGADDLEFGELLPETPGGVEQEEYWAALAQPREQVESAGQAGRRSFPGAPLR